MSIRWGVLIAAFSALPAPSAAGEAAPATSPSAASSAAPLEFFLGTWACEGRRLASPKSPEQQFRATYQFQRVLDGAWIATRYEEKRSGANPQPLKIEEHWGWDGGAKVYVNRWSSNFGSFGTFTAGGWQGDVWHWDAPEFDMGGRKVPVCAVFRRLNEREFVSTPSMEDGQGGWAPFAEFRCRR